MSEMSALEFMKVAAGEKEEKGEGKKKKLSLKSVAKGVAAAGAATGAAAAANKLRSGGVAELMKKRKKLGITGLEAVGTAWRHGKVLGGQSASGFKIGKKNK